MFVRTGNAYRCAMTAIEHRNRWSGGRISTRSRHPVCSIRRREADVQQSWIDCGGEQRRLHSTIADKKPPPPDGHGVLQALRANQWTQFLPVVILSSSEEEQDLISGYAHVSAAFPFP